MLMMNVRRPLLALALTAILSPHAFIVKAQSNISNESASPLSQATANLTGQTIRESTPLTIHLKLTQALRDAIRRINRDETSLQLEIETVQPAPDNWLGLRVFLNLPQGATNITTESPQYVGSIAFYGTTGGRTQSFTLDLGSTIRHIKKYRLLNLSEPLRVTLIAIPLNEGQRVDAASITIKRVGIKALLKK